MTLAVWVSRLTSKDLTPRKDQRVRNKRKRSEQTSLTFQLLEDTLHGTGAASAGHGHPELILVVRHGW